MTTPSNGDQFYSALQQKAMAAVADTYKATLYPVQYPAQGDFKWYWKNDSDLFSDATYGYVNALVSPGTVPGTVALSAPGGFANAYISVLQSMQYAFSSADKATVGQARKNAALQASTIVADYEDKWGTITPEQCKAANVDQKVDYVISYVLGTRWSGRPGTPLTYADMIEARDLRRLLPKAPASADTVIGDVQKYLLLIRPSANLLQQQFFGNWVLGSLVENTSYPDAYNGGMQVFRPGNASALNEYRNGWGIGASVASISNDLQNEKRAIDISITTQQSTSSSLEVHVDGNAGFSVGSGLQFSTKASGSYDMSRASGASTTCSATISYKGYTMVAATPAAWQQDTNKGFFYPDPIRQAIANGQQDVTGYKFQNPPPYDLGPMAGNGDFGLLTHLLIGNYPTVTISYENANYSSFAQSWDESVSGNLKLFGFIDLGGFSQGTHSSTVAKGSDNSSFTVTFGPSPEVVDVPLTEQTAFVIAAAVANPGVAG